MIRSIAVAAIVSMIAVFPAKADFVGPDSGFQEMVINIWRGRFEEAFFAYGIDADLAPRAKLRADLLFTSYHLVFEKSCGVPANSPTIEIRSDGETTAKAKVRKAYAQQVVTVTNRTSLNNLVLLFGVGPDAQQQIADALSASRQILLLNGCESPETRQFEENLARAVSDQISLQADGKAPDAFTLACLQDDIAGLDRHFSTTVEQGCECLSNALRLAKMDRRYVAALEDGFTRQSLLGVLASDPGLWEQARSCIEEGDSIKSLTLSLESSEEVIFAQLARIGCVGSPDDITNGLKRKKAVRCLQRFGGTPPTGKLAEADLAVLADIPDGAAAESAAKPRPKTVKLPALPSYLGAWRYSKRDASGAIVLPVSAPVSDLPGVTFNENEGPVEFPDLGMRVKEHWYYNSATLEILELQEFGPVWLYAYDKVAPSMRLEGPIQTLETQIRQARRLNEQFGYGEGGVNLSIVKMNGDEPIGSSIRNIITVPVGAPRNGNWQDTPMTSIELASRRTNLAELRAEHAAFLSAAEDWIQTGGCAISDQQLEVLDGAVTAGAILTGTQAREGDLLFPFRTIRERACSAPTSSIAQPHFVRFHLIMDRDCAFQTEAGKQAVIERAQSLPPTSQEYGPAILTRMTNGSLSVVEEECIGAALEAEFIR